MKVRDVTPENPVYLTKYALTRGIITCTVGQVLKEGGKDYYKGEGMHWTLSPMNRDAWDEPEAAEADARRKARRKIESIQKQLKRLEPLAELPLWEGK